jgi:hypothetical protein
MHVPNRHSVTLGDAFHLFIFLTLAQGFLAAYRRHLPDGT